MVPHRSNMLRLASALAATGAHSTKYELAFYHHFPDSSTICFRYCGASVFEWTASVGPLSFGNTGYGVIDLEDVANSSHVIFVDVFRASSFTECGLSDGGASLISGARRAPLLTSESNTFGYAVQSSGSSGLDTNRALDEAMRPKNVGADKVNLLVWNGASGLDECVAEIRTYNKTRWVVGPIGMGAGKELSLNCGDIDWGVTTFTFECGAEIYEYSTSSAGNDANFCLGSSQQVSLVGRPGSDELFAPVVKVVGGIETCPCSRSCSWSCISGAIQRETRGICHVVLGLFLWVCFWSVPQ